MPVGVSSSTSPVRAGRKLVRVLVVGTIVCLGLGGGVLWGAYRTLGESLPSLAALEETARPVGGTLVFSAAGDTVCAFYREKRVNVDLDETPDHLKQAMLSVEDWRFYSHWGIDVLGLGRAAFTNLRRGSAVQGASTLTQQLARNLFLSHEQTLSRKIKEAMLALRIERTYTKDEIFRMYLNQIYFGEGAYGIQAAARTYFDRPARDLDLLQAATLAGLPKNPNNYSPLDHPERAARRRNVVLRTMLDHGVLRQSAFDSLIAQPLITHPATDAETRAPYFAEEVRKYLESKYGTSQLYAGELRVFTTLDIELQHSAERAMENRFRELEEDLGLPHRRSVEAGTPPVVTSPPATSTKYLQGAVVALDPRRGRILAMVGGRDFGDSRFNRAVQAKRQPGSCFKPFVYAAAVQSGIGPSEILLDTPYVLDMGGGRGEWKPQNYTRTFSGPVSLRFALAKSLNVPAIKLQERVGTEAVIRTATRMGISSRLEPVLSLALGTSEVTLLELTSAYGTLANGGVTSRPFFIERIEDRRGRILERASEFHEEALDPQTAFVVTHMLQSVVDWGTAHNARDLYGLTMPAAGKTGTTDDLGDGWFVGYTPDLVVGVWGGFDERKPIGVAGSYIALPPWCDILRDYYETRPSLPFTEPPGIHAESICADSGKLSTAHCPRVQSEVFSSQTRPTRECNLHGVATVGESRQMGLRSLDDPSMHSEDLEPPAEAPVPRPPDQR